MSEPDKLTPEQITNWRKIWPIMFGVTATLLRDDDIQKIVGNIQKKINKDFPDEEKTDD